MVAARDRNHAPDCETLCTTGAACNCHDELWPVVDDPHADHLHAEHERLSRTFASPIPGGTYCENCGHLRHAHVDDHCVSKPIRSRAKRADESVGAQRDAALASVLALVRVIRKVGGYLRVEDQEALREAEALCAEVGR